MFGFDVAFVWVLLWVLFGVVYVSSLPCVSAEETRLPGEPLDRAPELQARPRLGGRTVAIAMTLGRASLQ